MQCVWRWSVYLCESYVLDTPIYCLIRYNHTFWHYYDLHYLSLSWKHHLLPHFLNLCIRGSYFVSIIYDNGRQYIIFPHLVNSPILQLLCTRFCCQRTTQNCWTRLKQWPLLHKTYRYPPNPEVPNSTLWPYLQLVLITMSQFVLWTMLGILERCQISYRCLL
jgi:hypothetical protein